MKLFGNKRETRRQRELQALDIVLDRLSPRDENGVSLYKKVMEPNILPTKQEYFLELTSLTGVLGPLLPEWIVAKGYYLAVTKELISDFLPTIKSMEPKSIIGIGSGRGKLEFGLNLEGIGIIPTDSWDEIRQVGVEKLNHKQALKKYDPDTVVMAFPAGNDPQILLDTLAHRSVKNVVVLVKAGYLISNFKERIFKLADAKALNLNTFPVPDDKLKEALEVVEEKAKAFGGMESAIFTKLQR